MKYKKFNAAIATLVCAASIVAASAVPVFAQTATGSASSTVGSHRTARMANLVKRADQEIDRRINNLNALATRIQSMKKLSSDEVNSLTTSIQSQITDLTNLKTKIDADTDLATLRTDVQSITKSYRIYILVIPQTTIMAAADRVMTLVDTMNTLGGKIQARITAAQSAGKDVSALQTTYSDFTAKISDANTQAQAAVSEVSGLTPDNGNQTQAKSNTSALKDARSKIQAAQKDLVAARKDAGTIASGLKALKGNNASSTVSSSTASSTSQ